VGIAVMGVIFRVGQRSNILATVILCWLHRADVLAAGIGTKQTRMISRWTSAFGSKLQGDRR
jgi:hypothetical protein